jgi:hypothetical protein
MLHLLPTHHETSKHISPHQITQFGVSSTEMHRIQIQTKASQLLITQINQDTNHLVSQKPTSPFRQTQRLKLVVQARIPKIQALMSRP